MLIKLGSNLLLVRAMEAPQYLITECIGIKELIILYFSLQVRLNNHLRLLIP
jgi:hypothetical protein